MHEEADMSTATRACIGTHLDSMWLRVEWETGSQVFEFPAGGARAIAVGSARSCDVRVRRRGLPPVCFCFEREANRILIVPMSDGGVEVAGTRITRPTSFDRNTTIEFGGTSVSAIVLTNAAEETEP